MSAFPQAKPAPEAVIEHPCTPGQIGKAPLPEELRGALGITGDDEDEDRAASAADDDGEADGDYAGLRWAKE